MPLLTSLFIAFNTSPRRWQHQVCFADAKTKPNQISLLLSPESCSKSAPTPLVFIGPIKTQLRCRHTPAPACSGSKGEQAGARHQQGCCRTAETWQTRCTEAMGLNPCSQQQNLEVGHTKTNLRPTAWCRMDSWMVLAAKREHPCIHPSRLPPLHPGCSNTHSPAALQAPFPSPPRQGKA